MLDKPRHPTLYIITYVDYRISKIVLIDNGLKINVISFIAFEILKVPIIYLNALTLTIRAFDNALATTMGTIILPIRVGVGEISTTCHVVKGEMQYNLLLGCLWIKDMESVLYTLHRCMKYLHKVMVYCIIGNPNPFSHCNFTFSPKSPQMPCGHFFLSPLL